MAQKQPHLMNRNGSFYFRYAISSGIQYRFGCKEFTYSLKTKDYHQAKAKIGILLLMAETVIKTVRQGRLTPEQARELARRYFKQALERLERQFDVADQHSREVQETPYKGPQYSENGLLIAGTENAPVETAPNFPLARKLDYLLPPEIDLTLDGNEILFFGK